MKPVCFSEGSTIADVKLKFREDDITMLKTQNGGLSDSEIKEYIEEDISAEIKTPSTVSIRQFVRKYGPIMGPLPTVSPTPDATTEAVSPSMTSAPESLEPTESYFSHETTTPESSTFPIVSSTIDSSVNTTTI